MSAKIFEIERPSGTPQLFLPLCGAEPTRAIVSVETASSKKHRPNNQTSKRSED